MYHRVADEPSDPFKICVTPQHFAEHLEVLKKHSHPMPLRQIVQAVAEGKSPHQGVAVTFDDGYSDNLHHAKPLLEQYDIPATVFVTTGNIDREREFWWDELERLLLQPGSLPKTLCLTIQDHPYQWDLAEAADYSEEDYQRDRTWNWYDPEENDPSPRQRIYRSLYGLLQPLLPDERQTLMDELLALSGYEAVSPTTHHTLSSTEVRTLAQGGLIEVGAHTVNHPFLSKLPTASQEQEIHQSKSDLEELIEWPIHSFAYPHGNYNKTTVALVQQAGFTNACSSKPHKVWRDAHLFELPRFEVKNWNGEEFVNQLSRWFYG